MSAPILSFCIPLMGRLPDLQRTLAKNLDDNRSSTGRVEFIVACFDEGNATQLWMQQQFPQDLESGLLRFVRAEPLPFWHFGRAKNAFKHIMRGQIYASLDGDNFTGPEAAEHIIAVFDALDHRCVFHQFQGTWGDGTSGRIALPRADYERSGYDERFLPRQWDEMDAMLSVLARQPDYFYACYRGKGVIQKSPHFRQFFKDHRRTPRVHEIDPASDPAAAHAGAVSTAQRSKRYVKNDPVLVEFSNYNQFQSFFRNTDEDALRTNYVAQLVAIQQKLMHTATPEQLLSWVLEPQNVEPAGPLQDGVTVLACLQNEPDPQSWYEHYRRLGARRFLLIDDGSAEPLADTLTYDQVHIWKPRAGRFRYAKTLWLEILLAGFCENRWCLTVDGDEFLSLPAFDHANDEPPAPLDTVVGLAAEKRQQYFCGFLLDLHPPAQSSLSGRDQYDRYQYRQQSPPRDYLSMPAVRWSYGQLAAWAWRVDLRYQLNQSVDSLRKFPLFRYTREMHLNQGFHDLIIDGKPRSASELQRADLLPIAHYKLWALRQKMRRAEGGPAAAGAESFANYHERTRENLQRLAIDLDRQIEQAANLPDSYPFTTYGLIPVPGASTIKVYRSPPPGPPSPDELQHRLERQAGWYFDGISEQPEMHGFALRGPDFASVIEWLRETTPFRTVDNESDEGVTLRALPDPAVKTSALSWLRPGWLSKKA